MSPEDGNRYTFLVETNDKDFEDDERLYGVELNRHPSTLMECRLFLAMAIAIYEPGKLNQLPFHLRAFNSVEIGQVMVDGMQMAYPTWHSKMFENDPLIAAEEVFDER